MSSDDPTLRARVESLRARGFRPTKTRGQNFLVDRNVLAAIVRDAGVDVGDTVVEVGVGLGFLTEALVDAGARVRGLEIDPELLALAREALGERAQLVLGDALATKGRLGEELRSLLPDDAPWHLVSNLPYSVSGPLLVLLARAPSPPASMTALVQLELAERVAAPAGHPARGPLGVKLQLAYDVRLGRRVGAQLFWPRPRVASAVVHLELARHPAPELVAAFDRVVTAAFGNRRKALRAALAPLYGSAGASEAALVEAGLDPGERAEGVAVEGFERLAVRL